MWLWSTRLGSKPIAHVLHQIIPLLHTKLYPCSIHCFQAQWRSATDKLKSSGRGLPSQSSRLSWKTQASQLGTSTRQRMKQSLCAVCAHCNSWPCGSAGLSLDRTQSDSGVPTMSWLLVQNRISQCEPALEYSAYCVCHNDAYITGLVSVSACCFMLKIKLPYQCVGQAHLVSSSERIGSVVCIKKHVSLLGSFTTFRNSWQLAGAYTSCVHVPGHHEVLLCCEHQWGCHLDSSRSIWCRGVARIPVV